MKLCSEDTALTVRRNPHVEGTPEDKERYAPLLLSHTRWLKYMVCSHYDGQSLTFAQPGVILHQADSFALAGTPFSSQQNMWGLARCMATLAGVCPPQTGEDLAEHGPDHCVWRDVILQCMCEEEHVTRGA